MQFTVVLDLLVTLERDFTAVFESEGIFRTLEVRILYEYALEVLGIEPECCTTFEPLLVGLQINVLELVVCEVCWHIGRL